MQSDYAVVLITINHGLSPITCTGSLGIQPTGTFVTDNETHADRLIRKGKNNPFLGVLIVAGLMVMGIATLTDSIDKLLTFVDKHFVSKPEIVSTTETGLDLEPSPPTPAPTSDSPQELTGDESALSRLLVEAQDHLVALRLTTPVVRNAFEIYQRVLEIEPENEQASLGLKRIAEKYVELANVAISRQDLSRAEHYLDKADTVNSGVTGQKVTRRALKKAAESAELTAAQSPPGAEKRTGDDQVSTTVQKEANEGHKPQSNDGMVSATSDDVVLPTEENNLGCVDEEALKYALAAAADIFSNTKQDIVYRKIVDRALCSSSYEIAIQASGSMFSSTASDEAYMEIVKRAIKDNRFELANRVTGKMFSFSQRDKAKRLVVDAAVTQ